MKHKFGDLQAKADAIQAEKTKRKFDGDVERARQTLRRCQVLPGPCGGPFSYPQAIQHMPIAVLREALKLELEIRKLGV